MKKFIASAMSLPIGIAMSIGTAMAAPPAFGVVPFEFVGAFEDCGPAYPAGTDTVTAKWDNSTGNPRPSILLQKLGATSNCAAAGVDIITPLEGHALTALTELNFDYKNTEHCGGGAPRFNIQTDQGTAFLGCNAGTHTPTSDPNWTHVEYGATDLAAAYAAGGIASPGTAILQDLYIIFDEGSDTGPDLTGTAHIDNISVNGAVVGDQTSSSDVCKKGGWQSFSNPTFKNQGDCVSYFNSNFHAKGNKNK